MFLSTVRLNQIFLYNRQLNRAMREDLIIHFHFFLIQRFLISLMGFNYYTISNVLIILWAISNKNNSSRFCIIYFFVCPDCINNISNISTNLKIYRIDKVLSMSSYFFREKNYKPMIHDYRFNISLSFLIFKDINL